MCRSGQAEIAVDKQHACCRVGALALRRSAAAFLVLSSPPQPSWPAASWCCGAVVGSSILTPLSPRRVCSPPCRPRPPFLPVAMAGKECVAIGSDLRFGVQLQTLATDYKKIYKIHDQLFIGLAGLGTDAETL